MSSKSAAYYDAIYATLGKNYAHEVDLLLPLIQHYKRAQGNELLDVACGTGGHLGSLGHHFEVAGLDLEAGMLAVARQKYPGLMFYQDDMIDFDLRRQFDVIVCLFSAIGYVRTLAHLNLTLANFKRHLKPGGVVLVEPWFEPAEMNAGFVHAVFVDQPDLKIARMNVTRIENNISILDFNFMVATPTGVEHFTELHELGLFTQADYLAAFQAAGFETQYLTPGIAGRGLYIGF